MSGNGQSELVRCVSGLQKVDSGKILLQEKDVTNASVRSFRDNGMSCIPEDRYFWGSAPEATLEENSLMGYEDKEAFSHKGLLDLKQVKAHAKQLIEDYKVKVGSPRQKIRELSGGNAQKPVSYTHLILKEGIKTVLIKSKISGFICCTPVLTDFLRNMEAEMRSLSGETVRKPVFFQNRMEQIIRNPIFMSFLKPRLYSS